ncbi:MAG: transcriptional regulator PpsR [Pseudomonadota bacterium]
MPTSEGSADRGNGAAAVAGKLGDGLSSVVTALSDIVLWCSGDGIVRDVAWNAQGGDKVDLSSLRGVPLEDTVTEECRTKVREMLVGARTGETSRWREINHLVEGTGELPVRYQAMPAGDGVMFVGRELRAVAMLQNRLVAAQRALDEDYTHLRQLQTRYRVLFQTSGEAILIVDGRTQRIQEANAAAGRLLGIDAAELPGQGLAELFSGGGKGTIGEAAARVLSSGQTETVAARADEAGQPLDCRLSVFRAADAIMLHVRLSRGVPQADGETAIEGLLFEMVGRIPDAVVLTDREGAVVWCNDAFLGMSETALASQLRGASLGQFISRPGVDLDIIIDNAMRHGHLRAFSSVLTGAFGSEIPVEIAAAAVTESEPVRVGFIVRDISRFDQLPSRQSGSNAETADHMMNLVGTVPLKELVRASTEEIEKMCIEAALQKTGNNRASAAEMLGLSRQSLYVKLRRFGLLLSRGEP